MYVYSLYIWLIRSELTNEMIIFTKKKRGTEIRGRGSYSNGK
jgi:hypothetical protein